MNEPTGSSVTLGFVTSQTGARASEGYQAQAGFELAVDDLNGSGGDGMLATFSSRALDGRGLLGKRINWVSADDQSRIDDARAGARRLIEWDGAIALFGNVTTSSAAAVQGICAEVGVSYFPGAIHGQRFTDDFAFRFSATGGLATRAVVQHAGQSISSRPRVAILASQFPDSQYFAEEAEAAGSSLGWDFLSRHDFPAGTSDIASQLSRLRNDDPDIVLACGQGYDLVNQLQTLANLGITENLRVVTPFLENLVLLGAGQAAAGVIGALDWSPNSDASGSGVFVRSFGNRYGYLPTNIAHTAYCQTILYADAVARAGSFDPHAVREALEGFEFDGLGVGASYMPPDNHELRKSLLIGTASGEREGDIAAVDIDDICPMCGTNSPESCSQNACRQGYCCEDGTCKRQPCDG
ncbi:MAG: ABC transporter substrate-binding protein [Sedimentitalea sp.]|uniref:ABC transporter substrate-binding protein n=1 Tax=Sedimentitalea sp. TaxID=2048915 RepID=UPI0032662E2E